MERMKTTCHELVCVVHDRFVAANEITAGEPLSP